MAEHACPGRNSRYTNYLIELATYPRATAWTVTRYAGACPALARMLYQEELDAEFPVEGKEAKRLVRVDRSPTSDRSRRAVIHTTGAILSETIR
jgi:hypothetical protein